MKKRLLFVFILMFLFITGCDTKTNNETNKTANIKLGNALYAAHGTKAFAFTSVVMDGDKISLVNIDELQYMSGENIICVPNGSNFTIESNGVKSCLASKRENNTTYSENMASKGGATKELITNYKAIEDYAKNKTVSELEALIQKKTPTETDEELNSRIIDAVSSSTLADTKGYIESIIKAANNAK